MEPGLLLLSEEEILYKIVNLFEFYNGRNSATPCSIIIILISNLYFFVLEHGDVGNNDDAILRRVPCIATARSTKWDASGMLFSLHFLTLSALRLHVFCLVVMVVFGYRVCGITLCVILIFSCLFGLVTVFLFILIFCQSVLIKCLEV